MEVIDSSNGQRGALTLTLPVRRDHRRNRVSCRREDDLSVEVVAEFGGEVQLALFRLDVVHDANHHRGGFLQGEREVQRLARPPDGTQKIHLFARATRARVKWFVNRRLPSKREVRGNERSPGSSRRTWMVSVGLDVPLTA